MSTPFIAEIRIVSFNFAPKGWAMCNGQLLPINQNQALFSILGTTYGGNGTQNFALPDLRGRAPFHFGAGFTQGQVGGEEAHTLILTEMPAHTHPANASPAAASQVSPAGALWANGGVAAYGADAGAALDPNAILPAGSSQPHENHSPYLVLNFIIALQGIFPPRF